jgi:hypothetical protein
MRCSARAASTGRRCKHEARPGRKLCIQHAPLTPAEKSARTRSRHKREEKRVERLNEAGDTRGVVKALYGIAKREGEVEKTPRPRKMNNAFRNGTDHHFKVDAELTELEVTDVLHRIRRWIDPLADLGRWNASFHLFAPRAIKGGSPKVITKMRHLGALRKVAVPVYDSGGTHPTKEGVLMGLEDALMGWVDQVRMQKKGAAPVFLVWVRVTSAHERGAAEQRRWRKRNNKP